MRDGAIKDLFDQDLIRVTIHVKYAATLSLLLGLLVVFSSLEQGSKNGWEYASSKEQLGVLE